MNFTRREIHVRGGPETATKNGEPRHVPIPELEQMFQELRANQNHKRTFRSRRALVITETELRLIAAAAMMGLSRRPVKG